MNIKQFWKYKIHPITGFRAPRRNDSAKQDSVKRKEYSAMYRAKQRAKKKSKQ